MNGLLVLLFSIIFAVCLILVFEHFRQKQNKTWSQYINTAKTELETIGFIYNHSYQLVSKKDDGKIRFLRIFGLKYNPNDKKVYAHCYMTDKNGEIGTWYDDYKYLLDIPDRWNLTDNGEWNPD